MINKKNLYKNTAFIFCNLILLIIQPVFGQQKQIEKVQPFYNKKALPEIFYSVPVGFTFTFKDGSTASTRGFLHGNVKWKKIKVYSEQGDFHHGKFHFDPLKVWNNNHQVTFRLNYKDTAVICHLELPYIKEIHFNLYTDSIKKGVPYYLNVEGQFSSGRIYPLDTTLISFTVSAGKLKNNILRISNEDSVNAVFLKAFFKWDRQISDSVIVPIKRNVVPPKLPSEKELMRSWKRKTGKR